MMQVFLLIFVAFCFVPSLTFAQKIKQSDLASFPKNFNDTNSINNAIRQAKIFEKKKPDSAAYFSTLAFEKSEKLHFDKGLIEAAYLLGKLHYAEKEYDKALFYLGRALQTAEKYETSNLLGDIAGNIATIHYFRGNYEQALKLYLYALKIHEKHNDKQQIAKIFNNLGNVFKNQKDLDNAMNYYLKSIAVRKEIGDKAGLALPLNNIGNIYLEKNEPEKALDFYRQSLAIKEEFNDEKGIAATNNSIATLLVEQKKYDEALPYYEKSLETRLKIKDKVGIAYTYRRLSNLYLKKAEYDKAIQYAEKSLTYAQELNLAHDLYLLDLQLYEAYKAKGDLLRALSFHENYLKRKDSIFNLENQKNIAELESKMVLEKREKELALLAKDNELNKISAEKKTKELEIAQKQAEAERLQELARAEKDKRKADSLLNLALKNSLEAENLRIQKESQDIAFQNELLQQKRVQNLYLVIVLVAVVILILVAVGLKQKQKANKLLEMKNVEISQHREELLNLAESLEKQKETAVATYQKLKETTEILDKSIQYAFQVQVAVMPETDDLKAFFSDLFILFRPKDVVSGDFYWFSRTSELTAVFALADCTGHGVPGAFMSMLGSTLLHETVNIKKVTDDPARILKNIHSGIRKILKQEQRKNSDGMDIAICVFRKIPDEKRVEVVFSGAKAGMSYVCGNELLNLKGDNQYLGGKELRADFTNQVLSLPEETRFYFYSDGYADQNNFQRKKFGVKAFKAELLALSRLTFDEQLKKLEKNLDEFQSGTEQRDDITVIGLKL